MVHVGSIDESVGHEVFDGAGLGEELEHGVVATSDDCGERVAHLHEGVAAGDHALVMEGDVVIGFLFAHLQQARFELLEVAPRIPVVGAEAGQIDVAEEEHAVGDPEPAVAAGVARQVHGLDLDTAAEVEHVAVGEAFGVGAGGVVELGEDRRGEVRTNGAFEAVDVEEAVEAVGGMQVVVVDAEASVGEQSVAGHVVFVTVAVQHEVDRHRGAALGHDRHRRIDDQRLARTLHDDRVAGGVGAVGLTPQHAHVLGEHQFVLTPLRRLFMHSAETSPGPLECAILTTVPDLIWNDDADRLRGELRRPLLLLAFEGLFDAAEAATTALDSIRVNSRSTDIAEIDPEGFFNFQETRPTVSFDNDGERRISWPTTRVTVCQTDDARDLVVMTGIEPHMRWKTFADQIIDVARRTGAEMVVTVGAMVSMVPHTRPFAITGSSGDPELADRLGLDRPSYQGPTGVVGVINQRVGDMGIPIISLRVAVPHYVPGPPNPKATRALLRRIQQTTRVTTNYEDLDADVVAWTERVDAAVASDDESRSYVQRLEAQMDSTEELLPSGDELAAELEAFLRDRSSDDDAGESADGGDDG